jgi:hypothetical protein
MTEHLCAHCGSVLQEVYDSQKDSGENNLFSLPDNLHEMNAEEADIIRHNNEEMIKLLDKLTEQKRSRIILSVEHGNVVIIKVCPTCRKIYDNRMINNSQYYNYQNNTMPVLKPTKKVVSDDVESVNDATMTDFDNNGGGKQEVFVSLNKPHPQERMPINISVSKYHNKERNLTNIPYVADEIQRLKNRPDKNITDVNIYMEGS